MRQVFQALVPSIQRRNYTLNQFSVYCIQAIRANFPY